VVLPHDVRLTRLAPQTSERAKRELQRSRGTRGGLPGEEEIFLTITGESRNDDALLRFVDNLFEHPFKDPNLTHEDRGDNNIVKFELNVFYRPGGRPQAVVIEETPVLQEEAPPRPGGRP
jgi:hypothetical protein